MTKNNIPWNLSDISGIKKNGLNVFSCFHCGGGSSMGYKLAGFNVLGGVEIDKEMMELYRENHKPKYSYLMGIQDFNNLPIKEIPDEVKKLDILDGSPPCSVFSMAGKREKKWGKENFFREGQKKQRLDDLFYHFIEAGKRLQPKVIIAENVKGLLAGNARGYVKEIFTYFREAGYSCQLFLFNASKMGVPQARERTFFIARRNDLDFPPLKPEFNERPISVGEAFLGIKNHGVINTMGPAAEKLWSKVKTGDSFAKAHHKGHFFTWTKINPKKPSPTVIAKSGLCHWEECRKLSQGEITRLQTFPDDYNFLNSDPCYVMGMSVPPFMTKRVGKAVAEQWLLA
ncbi:MAG: DNA (cytosine-5-)-methyltransferase [Halobacteriovorax sp.]|jgi:DNA (cytosine-5)-methyltransferase 1|nr:DNA (cytosine-5-)-methyltransferase [Halobacteriovorax sp.]|tara:strand:+ start:20541 stop:21569 length:1029 start_codon:yes stop_codon:yes gene_type:complete